jgi:hypothetical protein
VILKEVLFVQRKRKVESVEGEYEKATLNDVGLVLEQNKYIYMVGVMFLVFQLVVEWA